MNAARGNIYIAGIGGTFMGGVAQLAHAAGFTVRGCDAEIYSPMREVLAGCGIQADKNYDPQHLGADPGVVLIGNVLSRGNPLVEHILARGLRFQSGPAWLYENILARRKVIAVAGTHGKTTTASILAWILECAGRRPGFLIGGQPGNFNTSAQPGAGEYFVLEADEYDTAFFDKRAKFLHYHPRLAVLNNLEFDHADIYDDIAQIQRQFHHLLRIVPPNGRVVINADDARLREVLSMGCWSREIYFSTNAANAGAEFSARPLRDDCSEFEILHRAKSVASVRWSCVGEHNMQNALAAVVAAAQVGVPIAAAAGYLRDYVAVARRLQMLFQSPAVTLYDDFAHHPSAIAATIAAARAKHPYSRVIVALELRSNTMKMGAHGDALRAALQRADCAVVAGAAADEAAAKSICAGESSAAITMAEHSKIIAAVQTRRSENDVIITMSNGDFRGLPRRLAKHLTDSPETNPNP